MFRIKICGVTTSEDAQQASMAGADAIGFNFYEDSARYVQHSRAREIVSGLPCGVRKIGVFVNAKAADVCHTYDDLGLDAIQLHGDEPPPFLGLLGQRPVIRAFRCRDTGMAPVVEYLDKCMAIGCVPQFVLMDAYYPGQYGGTGTVFDWNLISGSNQQLHGAEVVLAGGLTPENIGEAIETARPRAVDTASGVESEPGVKDSGLVRAFVQNAQIAFARLEAK